MRPKKLSCLAAVIALTLGTRGETQGLSDLAKQEKERQAKARAAGPPARVYTDGATAQPTGSAEASGTLSVTTATSSNEPAATPKLVTPTPPLARPPEVNRRDRRSSRDVNITLYVTSWCPFCRKARALLSSLPNLKVTIHDIEQNKTKGAEMRAKTGGRGGIPVLDIEGAIIQGFDAAEIMDVIDFARAKATPNGRR